MSETGIHKGSKNEVANREALFGAFFLQAPLPMLNME